MKFVLADDSRIPLDILRRLVRDAGHEVVAACRDGKEAVEACKNLGSGNVDAVILDISMREMNGDVAAREIKALGYVPYIFIASSMQMDSIRKPLVEMGAYFIAKPYRPETLGAAFMEVFGGKSVPGAEDSAIAGS